MKKGTEVIISAAHNQVFKQTGSSTWLISRIYHQNCRICQIEDKSVMHIASSCEGIEKLYGIKHGIKCSKKWYQHVPEMSRYYGMWKLMENLRQQTRHNNPGERLKEIVLYGFHDTPGSPYWYERKQKDWQVSGTYW